MRPGEMTGASDRQYRRGTILGLTMAETFLLLAFAMLLLLGAWQVSSEERLARVAPVLDLAPEEIEKINALAADPTLRRVLDAVQGLPEEERARLADQLATAPEGVADILAQAADDRWRFVDADTAARVVAGVTRLPEDQQVRLADLVELTEIADFPAMLDTAEAAAPPDDALAAALAALSDADRAALADLLGLASVETLAVLASRADGAVAVIDGIDARLRAAEAADRAVVADLRRELGATVAAAGGEITPDGALVFPESVIFDLGSADVRPDMAAILRQVCPPWLAVLRDGADRVAGARIEGHASSDWGGAIEGRTAYLGNLNLSQARSAAVLQSCLSFLPDDDPLARWAERHLVAVGYSSARPILVDGVEDPARSRRVVFDVEFDRSTLLDAVQQDIEDAR